jgi:hypothetical protein
MEKGVKSPSLIPLICATGKNNSPQRLLSISRLIIRSMVYSYRHQYGNTLFIERPYFMEFCRLESKHTHVFFLLPALLCTTLLATSQSCKSRNFNAVSSLKDAAPEEDPKFDPAKKIDIAEIVSNFENQGSLFKNSGHYEEKLPYVQSVLARTIRHARRLHEKALQGNTNNVDRLGRFDFTSEINSEKLDNFIKKGRQYLTQGNGSISDLIALLLEYECSISSWMQEVNDASKPSQKAKKILAPSMKSCSDLPRRQKDDTEIFQFLPTFGNYSYEDFNTLVPYPIFLIGITTKPYQVIDGREMNQLIFMGHDLGHANAQSSTSHLEFTQGEYTFVRELEFLSQPDPLVAKSAPRKIWERRATFQKALFEKLNAQAENQEDREWIQAVYFMMTHEIVAYFDVTLLSMQSLEDKPKINAEMTQLRAAKNLKQWVEASLAVSLKMGYNYGFSNEFIQGDPKMASNRDATESKLKHWSEKMLTASREISY